MSENQELKNGKWVDEKPLKFKPCCVTEYIWIIKCKLKRIVKKAGAK